jgi:hypothetical protein
MPTSPLGGREITAFVLPDWRILRSSRKAKEETMKRSRRVVLTMMGSAAAGAVSLGLVPRECGPGAVAVRTADGRLVCRASYGTGYSYGGFGRTLHFHGHGHGHAGG